MPRYARRKLNGEYYHIVVQGLKKEFIFNSNERTIISEKELENIFGVSKGKAFKDIIGLLHDKYEEYEFLDVDKNENFKQFIELSKIIGRTNEQITIELSEKYKLSQRKIAELLNIKRNQVIKILK